jgi:hypothetical protein
LHKTLQLEYSAVKLEFETLQRESEKHGNKPPTPRNYNMGVAEWDNREAVPLDAPLFDISVFSYEDRVTSI